MAPPLRVCVTGAGGRTGSIVLQKMAERPSEFAVFGACRTGASAAELSKRTHAECRVCNVTDPQQVQEALSGVETLVVLSSATPKPDKLKMLGVLCQKFCCWCRQAKFEAAFDYPKGGMPKQVDWEGVKHLVDGAKLAGVRHVVIVGSIGGTEIDHFLNKMGGGNILLWKRKAEIYLAQSGLGYTIIHPGGLLPFMGKKVVPGGQRRLLVGVDDEFLKRKQRMIPREDVATLVLECVLHPEVSLGRSFDVVSEEPAPGGASAWDGDLEALLATLGGKNCNFQHPEHEILKV